MLQIAELRRADAKRARVKILTLLPPKVTVADQDDGLLSVAGPIIVGAYAMAMGIVALTFIASAEALFAISMSLSNVHPEVSWSIGA